MGYVLKAVPEPQAILRAWLPFKQLVGVTVVHTEGDYAQARATIDALLDLNNKRSISKEIAKRLAHRFSVRADVFL